MEILREYNDELALRLESQMTMTLRQAASVMQTLKLSPRELKQHSVNCARESGFFSERWSACFQKKAKGSDDRSKD